MDRVGIPSLFVGMSLFPERLFLCGQHLAVSPGRDYQDLEGQAFVKTAACGATPSTPIDWHALCHGRQRTQLDMGVSA